MQVKFSDKKLAILIVMLALATAWSIRGSFGHIQGAAWAGSIGVLALVLVSGRKDWVQNWPVIMAIGAIAWGVTGMISYGRVIGFGKSPDFLNASYGFLSLFLIGGLFGFLGGGLTGLMLESTQKKRINWAALITQMVAGAWIFWGFLIYQLHWFMTPPRSELWAACLGASAALGWYLKRNSFQNAWHVALITMLGAGFGFAFGNFLQVIGIASGVSFNWWNVMEYSIGFFGGLGMAYGIFSQQWDEMRLLSPSSKNWSMLLLFVIIPVVVIVKSFTRERFETLAEQLMIANFQQFHFIQWVLIIGICIVALSIILIQFKKFKTGENITHQLLIVLFTTWGWYKLLEIVRSGKLYEYYFTSEDLVFLNMIAVAGLWFSFKIDSPFSGFFYDSDFMKRFVWFFYSIILLVLILSGIAINIHDGLPGEQYRFNFNAE